jgi:hypothetical protein
VDRQQWDGSKLFEQMIADFPGHALAFLGVHDFGDPGTFLDELVLKEMALPLL